MKKHLARLATKVAIVLALVGGAVVIGAPAHAVTVSPVSAVAVHVPSSAAVFAAADAAPAITFDVNWTLILGLVVSTILPLIVGLVTKVVTAPGTRAVLLAALAAVTGLGTELLNALTSGTPYDLGTGLVLAVTSFLVAVGLHFGIWKPVGASEAAKHALGGDKVGGNG